MSTMTFKRGTSVDMNGTPITDGMLYFNTTDHKIYMDTDTTRLQYGGDTTLISNPTQASSDNAFNASASVNLFTQKTTVVDSKASALAVTNQYIPLGCLAFKEAVGTTNYSHVGNGTLSGAVVSNYNSIVSHTNSINALSGTVNTHTNQLTAGASGIGIYMDYQNGRFGYNTDPRRLAASFHPFSSGESYFYPFFADGTIYSPVDGYIYVACGSAASQVAWYTAPISAGAGASCFVNGVLVAEGSCNSGTADTKLQRATNHATWQGTIRAGQPVTCYATGTDIHGDYLGFGMVSVVIVAAQV